MSNPKGNVKHGGHGTLTYARWKSMMQRCNDPRASNYKYYGAIGVTVCVRWHEYRFFLADMGECPNRSMTLDRRDGKLGYQPGNCRWITQAEQNRNRPSHQVRLTHAGQTRTVTQWSRKTGITANVISMRLRAGWSVEAALTTPVRRTGGQRAP